MKKYPLSKLSFVVITMLLSACIGPKTPQEVNQAFWQAVVENKVDDIIKYSTLMDKKQYDQFSMDWYGFTPQWGKVVIEEEKASVKTYFSPAKSSADNEREFVTYLINQNGHWIVDYAKTNNDIHGGAIGNLLGRLSEAGKSISQQLDDAADAIDSQLNRVSDELSALANKLDKEAQKKITKFADEWRNGIAEFEQSIQDALKDDEKNWSQHDREVLLGASDNLQLEKKKLSSPSIEVFADSSRKIGKVQLQLNSLSDDIAGDYKRQWRKKAKKFEDNVDDIIDELSENDDK